LTARSTKLDVLSGATHQPRNLSERIAMSGPSDTTLIAILFGSIFLDSLSIKMFGGLFNIRPSFVAGALIIPLLAHRWLATRQSLGRTPLLPILLGLDASFVLSTVINWRSPLLSRGLISCALLLVNIAFFMT